MWKMLNNPGNVYWITGLSGSGKTIIGRELCKTLKNLKPNVVFLDGDIVREILGDSHGYFIEDRRKLAMIYSRLCKTLSEQGIDVVCSVMSLFKEVHKFNRENIKNYFEIFIECDMEELIKRDQKGLYSKAIRGEINDVVGVNLTFDKPQNCDLIIDNTDRDCLEEKVERIIKLKSRRIESE